MSWKDKISSVKHSLRTQVQENGKRIHDIRNLTNKKEILRAFSSNSEAYAEIRKALLSYKLEKPQIRYPKLIRRSPTEIAANEKHRNKGRYLYLTHNPGTQRDQRKPVKVPHFIKRDKSLESTSFKVRGRKPKRVIFSEMQSALRNGDYKGVPKQGKSTSIENEKRRLQLLNYLKGGGRNSHSILPKQGTNSALATKLPQSILRY